MVLNRKVAFLIYITTLFSATLAVYETCKTKKCLAQLDTTALNNFITYLKIPTAPPNIDYDECVLFLKKQAISLNLTAKVIEVIPKKPIVIITWEGTEPKQPSILLNGHNDVVPVVKEEWKYPPFDAHVDRHGDIYARGTQNMKSVNIQHIEAIRRLKLNGVRLKRTVHITFVPDAETGGQGGMRGFVKNKNFKNLKVGFVLDEGAPNPGKKFFFTNGGDKSVFQIWVNCTGKTGHGSKLSDITAGEKMRMVIDRFMDFRATEKAKLKDSIMDAGKITSINLTMLRGGVQVNLLPNELSAAFDIRLAPGLEVSQFERTIKKWFQEIGAGVSYSVIAKDPPGKITKLDASNIFWIAFKKSCGDIGVELEHRTMAGTTDARFVRALGIPALGFSPITDTTSLPYGPNEHLNKKVFLKGIDIFVKIIEAVANV